MKYRFYNLLVILGLIIFTNACQSQTYSFVYKFTDSILLSFQEKNPGIEAVGDTTVMELFNKLPMEVQGTYNIVSDGKYMIANAVVNSSAPGFRSIGVQFSEAEVIIDIKNKLIYFPDEKKIQKIKTHSLINVSEQKEKCIKKVVEKKGMGYEVKLCKELPILISPPVLFINNVYGVQSIRAPGFELELVSYKKVKDDKRLLNCKQFFEKINMSENEYDFFENY